VLCCFMQEAAYHHAENLGLGYSCLSKNNLGWVLSRQRIEVSRLPTWGETIIIRTWPSGRDRLFFHRDFEITDGDGNLILQASTAWSVIHVALRERIRSDFYLKSELPEVGARVFDSKLGRLKPCGCEEGELLVVNYGDLDMNGHVNNVRYIEWILDRLSLNFHESHAIQSLEVNYLAEAICGHTVSICSNATDPLQIDHGIYAAETELFRAKSVWKTIT
ncbi:MAG: thioesterase, partial [Kiritimatiellaceae bacterium]|nr:thioesterase [Kiritimatiellaceae bacterium]